MIVETSVLLVGGGTPEQLRSTVEAVGAPSFRVWCAVGTADEAAAVQGLARVVEMRPWPGRREALRRLAEEDVLGVPGTEAVAILAAGDRPRRGFLSQAGKLIAGGAGLVVGTAVRSSRLVDWTRPGRMSARLFPEAQLRPGSGLVVRADVFERLLAQDWLAGAQLTLAEISETAGAIRTLSGALEKVSDADPDHGADDDRRTTVTVLVPAHNEEAWIGDTLRSLSRQTRPPDDVLVVDDCSTDRTGQIARSLGARVLRTPSNRLKAGAQNLGLEHVSTDVVVAIDADTVLHPDALEHLVADIEAGCDATNGAILPRWEAGIWPRARVVEYATCLRLHKRAQRGLGAIMVLSGCLAAFRTDALRAVGGFKDTTVAEDMELTWRLHLSGYRVGYAPKALAYPAEPPSWRLYAAQMRRWSAGLYQCLSIHGRRLLGRPSMAFLVAANLWDLLMLWLTVPLILALGAIGALPVSPAVLGIWGLLTFGVPFLLAASVVGIRRAGRAMPAYAVVAFTNQYFYLEAFLREVVLRRRIVTWVKGH